MNRTHAALIAFVCFLFCSVLTAIPALASEFWLAPGVGSVNVGMRSMQELKYIETVRQ